MSQTASTASGSAEGRSKYRRKVSLSYNRPSRSIGSFWNKAKYDASSKLSRISAKYFSSKPSL
ncbi:MAG: hypothetical protein ILO42_04815, partial [Clostridia bacterium]|nr:hypothetical protein [Clostridia bacterium]